MAGLAADTRSVVGLPDPVGSEFDSRVLPNGLRLSRITSYNVCYTKLLRQWAVGYSRSPILVFVAYNLLYAVVRSRR